MRFTGALCLLVALVAGDLDGQSSRPNPTLPSLAPAEAAQALSDFRVSGLTVDLIARFRLRHLPRRGDEPPAVQGTLWMSWRHGQPAARIEVAGRHALVLRRDGATRLWSAVRGGAATPLTTGDQPLVPGFLLAAQDLQAPYADWPEARYLGSERRRGRPLNLYLATPPAGSDARPVRFGLDRAYLALIEASTLGADGKPVREMRTEEFARIADQWIVAKLGVRDARTEDRDVLEVTEACVDARLPAGLFAPANLGTPAPEVGGTFIRP